MNELAKKKWKICPSSGMADGTIIITETNLIEIMARMLPTDKIDGKEKYSTAFRKAWLQGASVYSQGEFIKYILGDKLGGRFLCNTIGEYLELQKTENFDRTKPASKRDKYVLLTTFQTDGFSIQCLVKDVTKPKKPDLSSTLSYTQQALQITRRKYPKSDDLPNKANVTKIVGVDFGETYAGGFVCKEFSGYRKNTSTGNVDYDKEKPITNLKIKTSALNEPTKLFQNWLNYQKSQAKVQLGGQELNIFDLELLLQKKVNEKPLDYWARWKDLYRHLSEFYNSKKVRHY